MSEFNAGDQNAVNRSGEAAVESARQGAGEASRLNLLELMKSTSTTGGGSADGSSAANSTDAQTQGQAAGNANSSLEFTDPYKKDDAQTGNGNKPSFNPDDLKNPTGKNWKEDMKDPPAFKEDDLKNNFDPKDIPGYEEDAKKNGEVFRRAQQEAEIKRMLQAPNGKDLDYPGKEEDVRRNGEVFRRAQQEAEIKRMLQGGDKGIDYPGREEDARRNGEQWQIRRMLRQLQRDKVDFQ